MEVTLLQLAALSLAMFFAGLLLKRKQIGKYKKELLKLENSMLRNDKDYLEAIKENEILKTALLKKQENEMKVFELKSSQIKKQA
jgi:hypothetical protein